MPSGSNAPRGLLGDFSLDIPGRTPTPAGRSPVSPSHADTLGLAAPFVCPTGRAVCSRGRGRHSGGRPRGAGADVRGAVVTWPQRLLGAGAAPPLGPQESGCHVPARPPGGPQMATAEEAPR